MRRKVVDAKQCFYALQEDELAMLIYLNTRGHARETLDQLGVQEMVDPGGLARIWSLLDEAYGEPGHDKFEAAEERYHQYHRADGTALATYLMTLKRFKNEYLKDGPASIISDKAFAQRMLNGAGWANAKGMMSGSTLEPSTIHEQSIYVDDEVGYTFGEIYFNEV